MSRTRKPRRKVTTELGRAVMQKERQRLIQEQAKLAEQIAEEAARSRREHVRKAAIGRVNERKQADTAVQRSIVRRIAGVLASEGVTVPLETAVLSDDASIDAWTDFTRIHVGYHLHEDPKLTAAVLRGCFYHEGGHCRFTLPFLELEHQAATAEGIDVEHVRCGMDRGELQRAWNALEDQRMETAVVSDSPRKAGYFVPMVLSELASDPMTAAMNWPLFVWRRYLPKHIRNASKEAFRALYGQDGDDFIRRIQGITTRYVCGNDVTTLYHAVRDMAVVLRQVNLAFDLDTAGHGRQGSQGNADTDIPIDPSMLDEADEEADGDAWSQDQGQPAKGKGKPSKASKPGKGKAEGEASKDDDDEDGQGSGKGKPKAADDEDDWGRNDIDAAGNPGGDTGEHHSDDAGYEADELSQEALDRALAEAESQRLNDPTLAVDAQALADAQFDATSSLDPYIGGINNDPEDMAEANMLAEQLKRAFEESTVDLSPSWHEQQRRGVINVLRHATRQPGDVEFFRAYVDNGNPGCDIAVSVLLDYSGSMSGVAGQLAKVAYGCKAACDMLNVPCTVVLWDTNAKVLWDASEKAENLPTIACRGGTNPRTALDDLDAHGFDKAKHLVLIMTDDAWGGDAPTLAAYKVEGRVIFGLGYTNGQYSDRISSSLVNKGADFAYSICNLNEISKHLEEALVSMS